MSPKYGAALIYAEALQTVPQTAFKLHSNRVSSRTQGAFGPAVDPGLDPICGMGGPSTSKLPR